MNPSLIVFVKCPRPGHVKTRLARRIGSRKAAEIYASMVEATLGMAQTIPRVRRVIAVSRSDEKSCFSGRGLPAGTATIEQGKGHLGARMKRVLSTAIKSKNDRAVIIGSDSPTLPRSFVLKAFEMLQTREVVLGPSIDGGYYLVGVRGKVPKIFDAISWSSRSVFDQTLARARRFVSTPVGILPLWYDVDEWEDLILLAKHLETRALF